MTAGLALPSTIAALTYKPILSASLQPIQHPAHQLIMPSCICLLQRAAALVQRRQTQQLPYSQQTTQAWSQPRQAVSPAEPNNVHQLVRSVRKPEEANGAARLGINSHTKTYPLLLSVCQIVSAYTPAVILYIWSVMNPNVPRKWLILNLRHSASILQTANACKLDHQQACIKVE